MSGEQMAEKVDLIVIGGGSGGLSAAREAARLGAKVILFDYVRPTVHGTKWGFGGTCVNVGCIPKKLMHNAGRIGRTIHHDLEPYGFKADKSSFEFEWTKLVQTVQQYIKSLNFSYRTGIKSAGVNYINAQATVTSPTTVEYTQSSTVKTAEARYIIYACGGRPYIPKEVVGACELCITSDDLFSLKKSPGKTLIVGGSYIALECAGFLCDLGFDVTVAIRSVPLRGFDQQCAEKVTQCLSELGVKFLRTTTVVSVAKEGEKLKVKYSNPVFGEALFDTVLYATGRLPETHGLEKVGVKLTSLGKIVADENDQSTVPSIFAIGDVCEGRPELTPVAVKAGELLSRRLFGGSKVLMDYMNVPTVVFTPVEYGCCGLSEEDACKKYGEENIEVYLSEFSPIEVSAAHWKKCLHADQSAPVDPNEFVDDSFSPVSLAKLICLKTKQEQVIGFHFVGLNAGELTQGFSLAVKRGLRKQDFDSVVGIHPTDAEVFTTLTITKRSGQNWVSTGGCGGGKCG